MSAPVRKPRISPMTVALRPPRTFDRAGRVELIGECARALRDGKLPNDEARLFVAGALLGWLENGGSLERDYLQVVKPKSHNTPAAIWRELQAHQDEGDIEESPIPCSKSPDTEGDQ